MRSAVDPPKSSSVIHERSNKPLHSPENHTKILARFCRKFERVNSVSTRNRKKGIFWTDGHLGNARPKHSSSWYHRRHCLISLTCYCVVEWKNNGQGIGRRREESSKDLKSKVLKKWTFLLAERTKKAGFCVGSKRDWQAPKSGDVIHMIQWVQTTLG